MPGPARHPWAEGLIEELHARPSPALDAPARVFHLALVTGEATAEAERRHIAALAAGRGIAPPPDNAMHYAADFGLYRLIWERHNEFSTYSFFLTAGEAVPFAQPALGLLPQAWIEGLAGSLVTAVDVALLSRNRGEPDPSLLARWFGTENVEGSLAAGGQARIWTDLKLDNEGAVRVVLHELGMNPRQIGRMVQRLLEIQTYCAMALLALPVAREAGPMLRRIESELADLVAQLNRQDQAEDDKPLLRRLTAFAAEIEETAARSSYRFGAARAYRALVGRRIEELRETRIEGFQSIGEFMDRRFAPAMRTCETAEARIESLAERVNRATQMLRTRIEVTLAAQNRDLLASMNQRAKAQLRLQQTVEGLSVVAITYYAVGLVGHVAQAIEAAGHSLSRDVTIGFAVPVIALLAFWVIRRIRGTLER
jgi:uncharacterized membrane-anchored protein